MSLDLNKTCSFVSSVEANIRRLDFLGIFLTHDPEMCSHKSDNVVLSRPRFLVRGSD